MSSWINFTRDERQAMIQKVSEQRNIDETAAEKDWWVTAVLYALFHTCEANYLLFKGGTSLSKGWGLINRFSEDIDLALDRQFFLEVRKEQCATCKSNTQIHHLREKGHDFILGEFKDELKKVLADMGLKELKVVGEDELTDENGSKIKVDHDKDPNVIFVHYPSLYQKPTAYAEPTVKIEVSVLSMSEPFEMKEISSLIAQVYQKEGIQVDDDYTFSA